MLARVGRLIINAWWLNEEFEQNQFLIMPLVMEAAVPSLHAESIAGPFIYATDLRSKRS
jgi:hypothetical protein